MANTSIYNAFERMWQHIVAALGTKSSVGHNHDDNYYTKEEINSKIPSVTTQDNGKFLRVVNGKWVAASVPNAEEASF